MVIGGDLNTQVNVGTCGTLLEHFSQEFSLCITNGSIPEAIDDWTFRSSMGVKRRLDYVLNLECFLLKESSPSEILNLGSDHRVVRTVLTIQKRTKKKYEKKVQMKKWRPILDPDGNASRYLAALRGKLELHQDTRMESMEKVLYEAAISPGVRTEVVDERKPWQSEEIQELIRKRRLYNNNPAERSTISKNIQKTARALLRKHKNKKTSELLQEFAGLERLPKIQEYSILKKGGDENIDCEIFAKTLQEIYESPNEKLKVDYGKIEDIPQFELIEMQKTLGQMRNSRCADKSNVVVEMIKYSDSFFQSTLLNYFNDILTTGKVPLNWHVTLFSMLPKSGDLKNPSNWRPIAILPILYKIFAKMLYYRLYPILDQYQPDDQFSVLGSMRLVWRCPKASFF